jgi:hypothetical protein
LQEEFGLHIEQMRVREESVVAVQHSIDPEVQRADFIDLPLRLRISIQR